MQKPAHCGMIDTSPDRDLSVGFCVLGCDTPQQYRPEQARASRSGDAFLARAVPFVRPVPLAMLGARGVQSE